MVISKTSQGTFIEDGIEYNTYPPPTTLVKVMKKIWAEALVSYGSMRFGSLTSYREWENDVLGDPNDGEGMFRMEGHAYQIGSGNPVYAWCSSLPTITVDRILILAAHGKYDCMLNIHDPQLLIQRVHDSLNRTYKSLHLHCSPISYNRGSEVDKRTLNSQKVHFNVFQKDPAFAPDMEYRLSLTDCSLKPEVKNDVIISVGDCSDIMTIKDLPNHSCVGWVEWNETQQP